MAWPAAVVHISPLICLAALPRSNVMLCRHAVCGARIDVCMEGVRWAQRRRLELKPCVGRVAGAGGVGGWQWQGWQGQGIPQRCAEQSERDEMCGGARGGLNLDFLSGLALGASATWDWESGSTRRRDMARHPAQLYHAVVEDSSDWRHSSLVRAARGGLAGSSGSSGSVRERGAEGSVRKDRPFSCTATEWLGLQ